jgi:tetratricopeptide (TPR) repeat protein
MALLRARAFPVFCFSVLWYLAGHLVESSFIPLEIAHAHRNYLPDVGLIFGIVYGLGIIAEQLRHAAAGIAVYVLVIIVMAFSTYSYASIWGDDSSLASHMVRYHPGSARSHAMLADIHAKPGQDLIKAITHYKIAWDLNPRETGYLIRLVLITANADVTVRNSSDKDNFNPTISGLPKFISIQKYGGTARLYVDPKMLDRITEDLSVNILLPWSERRLYKFVACVTHNKPICGPLYPYADKWCNAILENPHTYRRLRENVFVILVRLYFEHGDLERALRYTRKARSYNSTNPQFALMEANVLIELNELEKAEHVAQALIEKNTAINEYIVKEAHILLRMIKVKREKLQ